MKILTTVEKKKAIAHARFDWMWDSHTQEGCAVFANRDVAYMFLAFYLCLPEEEAHVAKIENEEYLDQIIGGLNPKGWLNSLKPLTRCQRADYVIKTVEKWLVKQGYRFPEEAAELSEKLKAYNNLVALGRASWEEIEKAREEMIELLG